MNLLNKKIKRAFALTQDLVEYLEEAKLQAKLPGLPSNEIGEQLWCMVGARESYLKAIKHNGWVKFSCSLKDTQSKKDVVNAILTSAKDVLSFIDEVELNETQTEFLHELLEHEIMHHGQLIRYMYGNKLGFPKSWSERYTV